ncbi:MAG: transcription elongation factor Spt5 [Candidatus Micrarchaeota archaeon]|nr:transcription elongation factor Spt5 [Candidatus Micrarchaeota archaeon]
MIFVYRVTAGQERVVADVLYNKIKKDKLPVFAIAMIDELRGYLMIEAGDEVAVRQAAMKIPHIKGVLHKRMGADEIDSLVQVKSVSSIVKKGDIVELVSGPFKGEKAKVIRLDENKEEITVELTEVAVPIPVTIKASTIRIYQKAEG